MNTMFNMTQRQKAAEALRLCTKAIDRRDYRAALAFSWLFLNALVRAAAAR